MSSSDRGDFYFFLSDVHDFYFLVLPIALASESEAAQTCPTVRLFETPWTVAYQAPPSMGFCRQECWSGLPFPSLGDLPDPGIEPGSPALQADALPSEPPGKPNRHPCLVPNLRGNAFRFSLFSMILTDRFSYTVSILSR